jgi:hypothetical protein
MEIDLSEKIDRALSRTNIVEDIVETALDDIDWEEKVREGLVNILG